MTTMPDASDPGLPSPGEKRAWRKLELTPEEARLRDTTAIALLSANPDLLRSMSVSIAIEERGDYIKMLVDRAYQFADAVIERRQE